MYFMVIIQDNFHGGVLHNVNGITPEHIGADI